MASIKKLKKHYEDSCNAFVECFEKKHGYEFSYWISDTVGGIACFIEQYFFNLEDIIFDIENNCEKGVIFKWQDDEVDASIKSSKKEKHSINFKSYIMGLRQSDLKIENKAKREFNKAIREYTNLNYGGGFTEEDIKKVAKKHKK